jgi:4-deoxy-L-threo-5-hexosulose-uronate ketol-isomerase
MKHYTMPDPIGTAHMSTAELRSHFLLDSLFRAGRLHLVSTDLDRAILGSAVPLDAPLALLADPEMRASFFCERRELGVFNIGGPGTVLGDGQSYSLNRLDCLYIGRGSREVSFASAASDDPARFYLISYPAHAALPTKLVKHESSVGQPLGSQATANSRRLYKRIHPDGVASCQLVMGYTLLDEGSCWNTMPPHTHRRRSEIYMYFDLDPSQRVLHVMGEPQETRHLLVGPQEAVLSPAWSVHAGAGTTRYGFCWAMGGENQSFDDMDAVLIAELR